MTPKEEAMHLEVKALKEFKPRDAEALHIYNNALTLFFEQHSKEILDILDLHFTAKYNEE